MRIFPLVSILKLEHILCTCQYYVPLNLAHLSFLYYLWKFQLPVSTGPDICLNTVCFLTTEKVLNYNQGYSIISLSLLSTITRLRKSQWGIIIKLPPISTDVIIGCFRASPALNTKLKMDNHGRMRHRVFSYPILKPLLIIIYKRLLPAQETNRKSRVTEIT